MRQITTILGGAKVLRSRRARREFAATVAFVCLGNAIVLGAILYLNGRWLS